MTDATNPADAEIMRLATADDDGEQTPAQDAKDDTLELGGEDAPEVKEPEKDEGDEGEHKTRSRPWQKRVDVLTARLREAERRAEEAEAKAQGKVADPVKALAEIETKKPDPNAFEYGEADPAYLDALTDWKLDVREAKAATANAERAKATEAEQQQAALVGKLNEGMASIEKTGAEKYEDFEAKIAAAVEARGGEPLPPVLSIGIAVSPVGADVAYKLASDPETSEKLEALATSNPKSAALAFGEIEGEFVADDTDLNLDDPLDMARMLGRMKARLAGKTHTQTAKVATTKAPEPPQHKSRGASGKFEVDDDTDDFAAFERKIMGKR